MPELCPHNRPVASCPEGCAAHARDARAAARPRVELTNTLSPSGPVDTAIAVAVLDLAEIHRAGAPRPRVIADLSNMAVAVAEAIETACWVRGDTVGVQLKLEVRVTRLPNPNPKE